MYRDRILGASCLCIEILVHEWLGSYFIGRKISVTTIIIYAYRGHYAGLPNRIRRFDPDMVLSSVAAHTHDEQKQNRNEGGK